MNHQVQLLNLLQLASPALPVGAYSYSDGLETLVEEGVIDNQKNLESWLNHELSFGAIRIEAAVMLRGYQCFVDRDFGKLRYWNGWLTASKESLELREQSWQMGNSLWRLLLNLEDSDESTRLKDCQGAIAQPCNYAIAFGIGAANWQLEPHNTLIGYLHSWATNLINVGIKLIPLGQTTGQQILFRLQKNISETTQAILVLEDDHLMACSWGLGLASMSHETQYTRLFRS